MKFDLCFTLVDLGDPFYKQAASEMIRSARRAYKGHDMRVVQLSDKKTAHCPDADMVMAMETDVPKEQMCQFKGVAIAEHALRAETPVIFCDVDIIWNNDGLVRAMGRLCPGVTALEREDMPSMPFNTGIIISNPGAPEFWESFRAICDNLPAEICGWWGDQIAMAIAWHKEAAARHPDDPYVVSSKNMDDIAPAIDTLPSAPLTTPAVHFKGNRKKLMLPYARMLDGGEGFEFARPVWNMTNPWMPDHAGPQMAADSTKLYAREGFNF